MHSSFLNQERSFVYSFLTNFDNYLIMYLNYH